MACLRLWTAVFLTTACCAPAALADVITTYDINFTTSSGDAPSAGSFTYDSTTPSFSDFTVTWEGLLFTLTGSANDPGILGTVPCLGGQTGAAASFALLSGACNPPDPDFQTAWQVPPDPTTLTPDFQFVSTNLVSASVGIVDLSASQFPPGSELSSGGWTITEVSSNAVPEPNSALFLATLVCACAFLMRKRIVKGRSRATRAGLASSR